MKRLLGCLLVTVLLMCPCTATGAQRGQVIRDDTIRRYLSIADFRHGPSEAYRWWAEVDCLLMSDEPIAAAEIRFIMYDCFDEDPKEFTATVTSFHSDDPTMQQFGAVRWEFYIPRLHDYYGAGFVFIERVRF